MKNIISLSIVLFFSITLFPQQQSNWQNYVDLKSANDIAATSNGIWAAAKGGAYFFNSSDNTFKTYSKSAGLNGTEPTAIAIDTYNKVWFGSANGLIDVFDPQTNSFHSILDIFNSDKTTKKINNISISGDSIYVATDFGITLIDSKNYIFYDTYFKFGTFTSNIKVNNVLYSNLIYASTEAGVVIQKVGATNLSAPESWNVYNQTNGLPAGPTNVIRFYNNTLLAGTNTGLFSFDGNAWQPYLSLAGNKIIDLLSIGNTLYILDTSGTDKVFSYDGTSLLELWSTGSVVTKLGYDQNTGLTVATNSGIFVNNSFKFPNGPAANQFPNMTVDSDGNLWSASGKDVTGVGIYKFDKSTWENYNTQNYPDLFTNAYYSIFAAPDNSIYAGNWGKGFVKIKNENITRYHSGNTPMVGITDDLNFVVITGFAVDSKNNLWIINLDAADKKSLYLLTPDSLWYSFRNPLEQHVGFSEVHNLVIDQYGTKWYSMSGDGSNGLFYYNEKGTYDDPNDDVYGFIATPKLSSNAIFSLDIDRRGDLWVGTSVGVNIISNLSSVVSSSNPQFNITTSFSIRSQTVNALAVDPLNQKWIGSNQGLFLLSTDGTQLITTINTNNSALLSDQIESLAIDESTGRVYVGTASGLTSFDTPSILPVESFNGLNIYPNPIVIKDGSNLVTIDGLIRNSDIKIVTVSGKLVREFSSPGGRTAFWNGRDEDGNLVSSGIYIIIAFDQEGNSVETGKIAVLRE
ncbi:MAG: hypothetical protein IPJ23_08075 [Ignavibacteriales bacterium]|nr:hypothetical protein [Ignavibacteriales bacterium]